MGKRCFSPPESGNINTHLKFSNIKFKTIITFLILALEGSESGPSLYTQSFPLCQGARGGRSSQARLETQTSRNMLRLTNRSAYAALHILHRHIHQSRRLFCTNKRTTRAAKARTRAEEATKETQRLPSIYSSSSMVRVRPTRRGGSPRMFDCLPLTCTYCWCKSYSSKNVSSMR